MIKKILRKTITPLIWRYTSAELTCANIGFSQFGEDCLLEYIFDDKFKGTFLDIGSFHPIKYSNTYRLYQRGWSGVAVDANPDMRKLFKKFRPRDKFINCCVGSASGSLEFAICQDPTFNCLWSRRDLLPEKLRDTCKKITVPSLRISDIIINEKIDCVDVLNIDCEGMDTDVLEGADWTSFRPKIIFVEDHSSQWINSETTRFLVEKHYSLLSRFLLTSVFIDNRNQSAQVDILKNGK